MNDDWRLQVDFCEDGPQDALLDRLDARELEHDLSNAFHDRVIVSRNGSTIFLYAGDREQAERARGLVERYAADEREELDVDFTRWHPLALEWRPADEDAAEALAERIRGEVPAASEVVVEATWKETADDLPPNPFAFLGGLGG